MEQAIFAGGCFWCTEAIFKRIKGVKSVESGYTGGSVSNPSYEQVTSGRTGHAEAIRLTYDPNMVQFTKLLSVFFGTHDPTTLNRQGNDIGTQYRSAIFYDGEDQKQAAITFIQKLEADHVFDKPIVTEITPLHTFYAAEGYHQDYYDRNASQGYCSVVISPKSAKLRKEFQHLLTDGEGSTLE